MKLVDRLRGRLVESRKIDTRLAVLTFSGKLNFDGRILVKGQWAEPMSGKVEHILLENGDSVGGRFQTMITVEIANGQANGTLEVGPIRQLKVVTVNLDGDRWAPQGSVQQKFPLVTPRRSVRADMKR